MSTAHHPLVIVGAGLGGLTLARVLHVHGIESVVLDLDPSPLARAQGGMLDIHEESGQVALREARLHDEFLTKVNPGGQAMRVVDQHANVLREEADDGTGGRPEIDRGDLRALLLASLPDGTVRWGSKATSVRSLGEGRHEVTLADGTALTTDLLVGADGAWSRVRPLLSPATPAYTGISFVELTLHDADTRHPECAALIGGGMFFAVAGGKGMLAHRETDGSLQVYVALQLPEDGLAAIDFTDTDAAKAALLEHFADWAPTLRALITEADAPLVPRLIHQLPVGHRWERVPGVTLLGDAAHLMSPFAGEGANLAMADGADLGRLLAEHPEDTEAALSDYEAIMFARAEEKARESAASLDVMFHQDAPRSLVDMFDALYEAARESDR
ncbi:2-polyprenyl-6-methoxyphenol hydroxylase [Streptoalloteichus tenebrarius]|uniref:Flavin-dependent monooxygenase n=1 Tax=Streptoalloteichus tenebrarius (strain ATCC 17920 / DSM 40477 / JCM 4838 / CBS 697.72 / NBRC 16177 / NCIMB 11028 / NRRL B-12390 / A12253. 1 / ISP 5477) TaxID=1933 RepID=A0ABT1HUT0_STRSD|nr:NAD(P)/FAD-dependent oxidoreductase [Streptoalloteichus tenebrarius]MCP2259279.1 2-polyprenyl-6-methoxyphenol hydroxylase [Streptoalloteichus tenebrarius]BFE99040.1 FAD-dependent monooxygenase [Streptoalloteichus tenebrarius]